VLFISLGVDSLTTLFLTRRYGIGVEINPVMRWLLQQGPVVYTGVHVLALLVVISLFSRFLDTVRSASPPSDRYLEIALQVWLGLLIVVGLFVVTSNLSAIVFGESLIAHR
jgi:hypothetical protein